MAMLSSPATTLLLQKNIPVALTSTPSVFLGGDLPDTPGVEIVMPVMRDVGVALDPDVLLGRVLAAGCR